jgi:hypothetical protein
LVAIPCPCLSQGLFSISLRVDLQGFVCVQRSGKLGGVWLVSRSVIVAHFFAAFVLPEYFRVQCSKLHAGFTSGLVDHLPMCPTYLFHGCHVFAGNIVYL